MIIATALSIAGLGFFCWLLFTFAIYALPFFAGLTAGLFAYESGAGPLGAMAVALTAGVITLVAGQFLSEYLAEGRAEVAQFVGALH